MLIDCQECLVRDDGVCGDCVVTFILTSVDEPRRRLQLEEEEIAALEALADEGLLPPLRLVSGE
jgi:hypothetical protein